MARAFVIRPFGRKKDSTGKEFDFEKVHTEVIGPALTAAQLAGSTTGEIIEAGNIREDMFSLILEADVVVCDVTIHNANVFYELGIRHALRKRNTILIREPSSADAIPFDLLTDRYLEYRLGGYDEREHDVQKIVEKLARMIESSLLSERETDSPIFKMLPTLPEADPAAVQAVPKDFREEVERAQAARSKGWLRLLAQEVRGMRYEWIALQLIAGAQLNLKDYVGARESLETLRQDDRDDIKANLALANIYERLYRDTRQHKPELLASSDHAIERVLANGNATQLQRVESLALRGRNQKTRWRQDVQSLATVEERRRAAMNLALRASYQAYRDAFAQDLNHFWSGLAALQQGTIFLGLSETDETGWKDTFDTDEEAEEYRRALARDVAALQVLVSASSDAGLERMEADDPERVWAAISTADILFLTESREQRVIKRYQSVVPTNNSFAWDAARGQLQLFIDLGVKAELARAVIAAIDDTVATRTDENELPPRVVIFAGHGVDASDRPEPRFPTVRADDAKRALRDALRTLADGRRVRALASAVAGADILFHEACSDLEIDSTICLPMPAADYASSAYRNLDEWRTRFLDLRRTHEVLELSDRAGLPRWLHDAKTDPWERGNRWVLQMALTAAADVTLLVLWDGKPAGDAPGGTAHMVELARAAGTVDVWIIDVKTLLGEAPP